MRERYRSSRRIGLAGAVLAGVLTALLGSVPADGQAPSTAFEDPAGRLIEQLQRGTTRLDYMSGGRGFLPSLLEHLDINIDSQMLVFSKTSFRSDLISPKTPRAVYFNDNVLVGFVQHGDIELVSLDPHQGPVFYTVEAFEGTARFLRRDDECASCHGPARSSALLTQSVFPDREGNALFLPGLTPLPPDHTSPLEQRWGGWYVTGTLGSQRHMGNAVVRNPYGSIELDTTAPQNLTRLDAQVDLKPYLAPTSDLIALMTFEHQVRLTNLIALVNRLARPASAVPINNRGPAPLLEDVLNEMLRYMLFVDEQPLKEPIKGVSKFTSSFPKRGPRDSQGRSLRDFELQKRLFRYPLSYMIYSPSFEAIPLPLKTRLYARLYDALTGVDGTEAFPNLTSSDRRAIYEILRETKRDLPAEWAKPFRE